MRVHALFGKYITLVEVRCAIRTYVFSTAWNALRFLPKISTRKILRQRLSVVVHESVRPITRIFNKYILRVLCKILRCASTTAVEIVFVNFKIYARKKYLMIFMYISKLVSKFTNITMIVVSRYSVNKMFCCI